MTAPLRPVGYLDELRRIVPTEQIEPQPSTRPGRGGSWAVEPATLEELVDVLKWANERHAAVFTRHPRANDGERSDGRPRIYLRGRRMSRVKDLDIVSGTITVQAGITMKELHERLDERGFSTGFVTRPWRQESLGSVLAATLDSHWGPRFGFMEEQVVSLGVVFPDGTAAWSRRSPRKAVGPDFDRLFLGTRGRFGIIYEATLRIYAAATRVVLSYSARTISEALETVRHALDLGVAPRAVEILIPAPDRAWGRKRVGLTDARPVLVLVEPWHLESGRRVDDVDRYFGERLERLSPPAGWDIHEGLLPAPRAWTAPVAGLRWAELNALAVELASEAPAGLWCGRTSRHGAVLSLASEESTPASDRVRAAIKANLPPAHGPWRALQERLELELDPHDILNPY